MVASNDKKVDKNLRKEKTEIFKQEKPKDEKRILDFFTKFFDSEDQKSQDETLMKNLRLQMIRFLPKNIMIVKNKKRNLMRL